MAIFQYTRFLFLIYKVIGKSQIPNSSSSVLGSDWNMCPILFGSLLLLSAGLCSLAGHAQFRGQPKILLYVVCRF